MKAKEKERQELNRRVIDMTPLKAKVVLYYANIYKIGGIESWLHYISHIYGKDTDILVLFNNCDKKQQERLNKLVRTAYYCGQEITGDVALYAVEPTDKPLGKHNYLVIHAVYEDIGYPTNKLPDWIEKVYAVSKVAGNSYERLTGIKCEVLRNPICVFEDRPLLKILVASRLSLEKGGWRVKKLIEGLQKTDYPWLMMIFTDLPFECDDKRVIFMDPTLEIGTYMNDCTYVAQLSNTEASCYTIKEALIRGKPIIVTDLPMLKEEGIDQRCAKILKFDMSNLDIDDIYNNVPRHFVYKPYQNEATWKKLLGVKDEKERPKENKK